MARSSTKDPLATREARRQFKRESSVERKHDNGDVHPRVEHRRNLLSSSSSRLVSSSWIRSTPTALEIRW